MYNSNLFVSFFNKSIALLVIFSLLSISFSFNIDENVKQEIDTLYKSTSICEYYNSLAKFSYGVINKILESTNIFLTYKTSQSDNNKEESKKSGEQNNLYFVKTTTENDLKISLSKDLNDYSLSLLGGESYSTPLLSNIVFKFHMFKLTCITVLFCYFARGNIDIINFNNMIKENRLV